MEMKKILSLIDNKRLKKDEKAELLSIILCSILLDQEKLF